MTPRTVSQAQQPAAQRTVPPAQPAVTPRTTSQAQRTVPQGKQPAAARTAPQTAHRAAQPQPQPQLQYTQTFAPGTKPGEGKKKKSKGLWIALACVAVVLTAVIGIFAAGVFSSLFKGTGKTPSPVMAATEAPELTARPDGEPTAQPGGAPSAQPTAAAEPGSTAEPGAEAAPEPTEEPEPEPTEQPPLPELIWSDWNDHLPEKVSGENSAIEMRLVYRSVPIREVVDSGLPTSTCIKLEDRTWYSNYDYANAYVTTTKPTADDLTTWTEEPITESVWSEWKCWVQDYQTPTGKYQERENFTGKDAITWKGVAYSRIYREYLGEKTVGTKYTVVKRHRHDYYYDTEGWSEYSPVPILQQEDLIISTKMQYRYAASENGRVAYASMDNFPVYDEDYRGRFQDVDPDKWYAPEKSSILCTVCELGILLPDGKMNFHPEDAVTLGQVIRAAVIINRVYNGCAPLLSENTGDYQAYLDYAVEQGLLRSGELTELDRMATRQEMAYLFCRALPEEELQAVREDITEITDMDKAYVYYDYALQLARANVITLQKEGTFKPMDGATRAQLASIVDKMIYPQHR